MYKEKRYEDFRELVNSSAKKYKNKTAFLLKNIDKTYLKIGYTELKDRYYTLCNYFLSKGYLGKRIAVIGENSFDWVLCYLAASTVGVVVPLDKELGEGDIKDFLDSSEAVAICHSKTQTDKIKDFERIDKISFSEARELSIPTVKPETAAVDAIEIRRDEMRILIFTSGTTGNSKGVCLSQYNICSNIHSTCSMVKVGRGDTVISILPLHHTYECTLDCLLLLSRGVKITYAESLTKIPQNIKEYSPTVLVVVPALLETLARKIKAGIIKGCPSKYVKLFEENSLSDALARLPFIVRKVIIGKVKKTLGGRLSMFIVGAAELDTSIVDDFSALGIRTLQGYGLTECSPLLAGNSDFWFDARSTGRAIPGVTLKIDNPNEEGIGEILAKGDNIMLGYFNDKEATDKVFRDGWFCTGDLGAINDDGHLFIKGRIKNVIVTANGKNIYPEDLETRIMQHAEISEVLVTSGIEHGSVCVRAKILPNLDYLKQKLGRIPSKEDIKSAINQVIKLINTQIPSYKHVKIIEILTSALEKTTTQKIKRFGKNLA